MANVNMEVDAAEEKLKMMEHSEQHYFKRYGHFVYDPLLIARARRARCGKKRAVC